MSPSRLACVGVISCLLLATACSSSSKNGGGAQGDGGGSNAGDSGADAPLTSGDPTGLWIGGILAYSTAALAQPGTPAIGDECPIPNDGASTGPAAFDGAGNLWTQQASGTVSVIMWSAAELTAACSSGPPARTITLAPREAVDQISAMAFDAQGTLWLSFVDYAALAGISSEQLTTTGTVAPKYFIQYGGQNAGELHAPVGLAFDTAGDLWVGNLYSVLEYTPATLATGLLPDSGGAAMPTADAYLSTVASEAVAQNLQTTNVPPAPTFRYVAFDKSGNLWVDGSFYGSQQNSDYIAEYAASDLAHLSSTSTPAPLLAILETPPQVTNFASFGAIAFDATGDLWLGSNADLFRVPTASVVAGDGGVVAGDGGVGNPFNPSFINLPTLTGLSLAFNPIPAGLPIRP